MDTIYIDGNSGHECSSSAYKVTDESTIHLFLDVFSGIQIRRFLLVVAISWWHCIGI